jgi:hypothetical protein
MNRTKRLRELINLKLKEKNMTKVELINLLQNEVSGSVIYTLLNENYRYSGQCPYFRTVLPILKALDIEIKDF